MDIIFHEDRCLVSGLPTHVRKALESEKLFNADKKRLDFCGMIMKEDRADIFLPRNSKPAMSSSSKKLSASLIRAIHKYTQNRERLSISGGVAEYIVGDSLLGLAFTLLTDYIEYGLYVRRKSETRRNVGKTDWKRTISRAQSYPLSGSLIYLDTFGRKSSTRYDEEITLIHAEVIRELNLHFGWIFFDIDSSISSELADIPLPTGDKEIKIGMLERELGIIYSDREMKLMKDLISFLEKKTGKAGSSLVIGINGFHSIWEHMIDSCMQWKFDINHKLAKPCYLLNGEHLISAQKGGRTDTVIRSPDESKFVIIDAKYYGANNVSNMPGWPDLIKQFFYAAALKDIYPDAIIYNCFVFPGVDKIITSAHLQDPTTKILQDEKYLPIECIYLEPMTLINCYISGGKLVELSDRLLNPSPA